MNKCVFEYLFTKINKLNIATQSNKKYKRNGVYLLLQTRNLCNIWSWQMVISNREGKIRLIKKVYMYRKLFQK